LRERDVTDAEEGMRESGTETVGLMETGGEDEEDFTSFVARLVLAVWLSVFDEESEAEEKDEEEGCCSAELLPFEKETIASEIVEVS
jgi:hypothetical protein